MIVIWIVCIAVLAVISLQSSDAWAVHNNNRIVRPTSTSTANRHFLVKNKAHPFSITKISNHIDDSDEPQPTSILSSSKNVVSDPSSPSQDKPVSSSSSDFIPEDIISTEFHGRGCVLLAQKGEYDHFMMQSAIFIYDHDSARGSQGVILDKQSAFTLGEMSLLGGDALAANPLFLGGSEGGNAAIMLHRHNLGGLCKYVAHGIYLGGMKEAKERLEQFQLHPKDFKFIFNNIEWPPGQLEKEIAEGRWDVCLLPPKLVLGQKQQGLWSMARNALRAQQQLRDKDDVDEDPEE